jgi:hypothetical protein
MAEKERQINVDSIVSHRNKQPYVVLTIDETRAQLPIPKAREIAYWILRATSTAEADAFLVGFLAQEVGITAQEQAKED